MLHEDYNPRYTSISGYEFVLLKGRRDGQLPIPAVEFCLLKNSSNEQEKTHDRQRDADDGADDRQTDEKADEHEDNAQDHGQ